MKAPPTNPDRAPLDSYHKKLLAFLCVASFFDGFDFIAIAQLLPNVREEFGMQPAQGGLLISAINLGTVAAYLLLGAADRLGRRRTLTVTILGYTLFTLLSGLAPNVLLFGIMQFAARMFLIAEVNVAMVYAAEEFPADRRGLAIGTVQGFLSLGMIACAASAPTFLKTEYGWRSLYFAGVVPLLLIAFGRRSLRESRRFAGEQTNRPDVKPAPMGIWRGPYRGRMLRMGVIWCCTYVCTQSAVMFWKEFAVAERGFSDAQVGMALSIASLAAMPLVFLTGHFLDRVGRRRGAAIIFSLEVVAAYSTYSLYGFWPLTLALVLGIFGASAVLVVLNTFTTELFPTRLRGSAFAWSNNLLGRIGYVLSPLLVGQLAGVVGWGWAVRLTVVGPLLALVLILTGLPETNNRELEVTSEL